MDDAQLEQTLFALLFQRSTTTSICPSEVARAAVPDGWRALMPQVRAVASRLALQGRVHITQRGQVVAPEGPWRGPIRIRLTTQMLQKE